MNNNLLIKIQTQKLKELLKWKKHLPKIQKAIKNTLGNKTQTYIFGSAPQNKLTIDSDIDIAIVLDKIPQEATQRAQILNKIWKQLENQGIPWWYPLEIHLITKKELQRLKKAKTNLTNIETLTNQKQQSNS